MSVAVVCIRDFYFEVEYRGAFVLITAVRRVTEVARTLETFLESEPHILNSTFMFWLTNYVSQHCYSNCTFDKAVFNYI